MKQYTNYNEGDCRCQNQDNLIIQSIDISSLKIPEEPPDNTGQDNPSIDVSNLNILDRNFDNSEQYINNNGDSCHPKKQDATIPFIEVQNLETCKEPKYLLIKNFLSEYNTNLEKQLVMQNILLLDKIPTEGSTRLINSGSLFNIMKENKVVADYLTSIVRELKDKVDSSDLSRLAIVAKTGSYNDLKDKPYIPLDPVQPDWNQQDNTSLDYIKNKPVNVSEFINDVDYVTQDVFPILIRDNASDSLNEQDRYKLVTVGAIIDVLDNLNQSIENSEETISTSLNDLNQRINDNEKTVSNILQDIEETTSNILQDIENNKETTSNILQNIEDDEEVVYAALNDLNSRDKEVRLMIGNLNSTTQDFTDLLNKKLDKESTIEIEEINSILI